MVTVAFIRCFSCFSCFSYCRGNCICAGQGNTIVSHFVVQRGDFTVAIACVPCGPRRSLIYAWAWGFWVCWKLSAAEQVKTDCCNTPAVVSTLLTPLPVSCPLTTPLHYITVHLSMLNKVPGFYCYSWHTQWTCRIRLATGPDRMGSIGQKRAGWFLHIGLLPDRNCLAQNLTQSARTKSDQTCFCTILSGTSVEERNRVWK